MAVAVVRVRVQAPALVPLLVAAVAAAVVVQLAPTTTLVVELVMRPRWTFTGKSVPTSPPCARGSVTNAGGLLT